MVSPRPACVAIDIAICFGPNLRYCQVPLHKALLFQFLRQVSRLCKDDTIEHLESCDITSSGDLRSNTYLSNVEPRDQVLTDQLESNGYEEISVKEPHQNMKAHASIKFWAHEHAWNVLLLLVFT